MLAGAAQSRWSRADIESRVKLVFWSSATVREVDLDECWLRYSELKRAVSIGGPHLADKTFSSVLKLMRESGVLERNDEGVRPRYRLRFRLVEQEVKQAILAADLQRLQAASLIGVRADLKQGVAVYAIDAKVPIEYRPDLRRVAIDFREV